MIVYCFLVGLKRYKSLLFPSLSLWFHYKIILKMLLLCYFYLRHKLLLVFKPKQPKSKALLFVALTKADLVLCKGCRVTDPLKRMADAVCFDKLLVCKC